MRGKVITGFTTLTYAGRNRSLKVSQGQKVIAVLIVVPVALTCFLQGDSVERSNSLRLVVSNVEYRI